MATYQKRLGRWRVAIFKKGVRKSASFDTKEEAQRWASEIEFKVSRPTRHTLHDALQRYADTVSIHKRGQRWERVRIAAFKRQLPDRQLSAFTSDQVSKWRDGRLNPEDPKAKPVSTGTVRREMNLFGNILKTAESEWKWIDANPFKGVKRPPDGDPRRRVITDDELTEFIGACRSHLEKLAGKAFAFAIETGMRAGEIVGIRAEHAQPKTVMLPRTKNKTSRLVPLSAKARKLLPREGFGLNSAQLDVHFRNVRDRLGQDYTFHASRHTAATRIGQSGKLTPFELAAMFGWKDLNMAMRYVNSSILDIADRL